VQDANELNSREVDNAVQVFLKCITEKGLSSLANQPKQLEIVKKALQDKLGWSDNTYSAPIGTSFEISLQDYLAIEKELLENNTNNEKIIFKIIFNIEEVYIKNQDGIIKSLQNSKEEAGKILTQINELTQKAKVKPEEINKIIEELHNKIAQETKNLQDAITSKTTSAEEELKKIEELGKRAEEEYGVLTANISADGYRKEARGFSWRFHFYSISGFIVLCLWCWAIFEIATKIISIQTSWALSLLALNTPFIIAIILINGERKDAKRTEIILTEKANALARVVSPKDLNEEERKTLFNITVRDPLEYEIRLKELNTIKAFSRRTKPELALKEAKDLIDVIKK